MMANLNETLFTSWWLSFHFHTLVRNLVLSYVFRPIWPSSLFTFSASSYLPTSFRKYCTRALNRPVGFFS
jgi:hypothetical protein